MSTPKFGAVDDIRRFARTLRGFLAFADELEKMASFEQAARETEQRLEEIRKQEAAASQDLAVVLQDVEKAKASAAELVADGRTRADQALAIAKKAADEVLVKAQADAQRMLESGKRVKADLDALAGESKKELDKLTAAVAEKQAIVADLDAKISAIRKQLGG